MSFELFCTIVENLALNFSKIQYSFFHFKVHITVFGSIFVHLASLARIIFVITTVEVTAD